VVVVEQQLLVDMQQLAEHDVESFRKHHRQHFHFDTYCAAAAVVVAAEELHM
jgi:hypothetical protein